MLAEQALVYFLNPLLNYNSDSAKTSKIETSK